MYWTLDCKTLEARDKQDISSLLIFYIYGLFKTIQYKTHLVDHLASIEFYLSRSCANNVAFWNKHQTIAAHVSVTENLGPSSNLKYLKFETHVTNIPWFLGRIKMERKGITCMLLQSSAQFLNVTVAPTQILCHMHDQIRHTG
jgi:hypothetical protein